MRSEINILKILRGHSNIVFRFAWSPDGNRIASPSKDKSIIIWTLENELLKRVENMPEEPNCVSWLTNDILLIGLDGGSIVQMDLKLNERQDIKLRKNGDVNSISCHPLDKIIALGTDDNVFILYDMNTLSIIDEFYHHRHWIIGLDWSKNGQFLAAASRDSNISILNYQTSKIAQLLDRHSEDVNCVKWSPIHENILISCSNDKSVKLWNTDTGEVVRDHNNLYKGRVNSVSFSYDGSLYASKSQDDQIRVFDFESGDLLSEFSEIGSKYIFPSIAFHPSKKNLATLGEQDTVIRLWDYSGIVNTSAYDVFISHASEDKELFVRPLVKSLVSNGINVWYDEFELKLGDNLRRSIDKGLSKSKFGIVILSHAFYSKNWPQYELDGLFAREIEGNKVILPIWYNINKNDIMKYSPSMTDKIASIYPFQSIELIVKNVIEVIKPANNAWNDKHS